MVATWDKGELVDVNPDVIEQVAKRITPDMLDDLEPILEAVREHPDDLEARNDMLDAAKPVIAGLIQEVSATNVPEMLWILCAMMF